MSDPKECLVVWRGVLGWCVLLGAALLFVWAGMFFAARGVIESQGAWFGLTPRDCALIHYCGMGLVKGFILVFFVIPYLAIRFTLRKV